MIEIKSKGNLLSENVEALTNTVNCVGIMGKGIALQFKQAYPENFKEYKKACDKKEVAIGKMFVFKLEQLIGIKYIINFSTKNHWKERSRLKYIINGLDDLVEVIKKYNIKSIAIPPLGCGNGGLNWNDVKPLITRKLGHLSDVRIVIFEPSLSIWF